MDDKRNILIVFDIDETLIQFINKNAYHYWKEITSNQKDTIDDYIKYTDLGESKQQVVFFRPGLKEFLEMVSKPESRIKVALWTYSEREYADYVSDIICSKFSLDKKLFLFKYGAEDIEDDDIPKSLNKIWTDRRFKKKFNKFNTFLVDDRYGNLCHKTNVENSILIQAFAPFGESKAREALTDNLLDKAITDKMFMELTYITNNLIRDIDGCDDEEINEAFTKESIFAPKCIARKNLTSYVKQYKNDTKLCTIGEVDNATSHIKGGRYKNKSNHKNKSNRKNKKNRNITRKYKKRK